MPIRAPAGVLLTLGLLGCGGAERLAPAPAPDGIVVMRPHWDQVCRDADGPLLLRTPDEVLDEGDLTRLLERFFPSTASGPGGTEPPFVDVAINYDPPGSLRMAHLLDHNVDEAVAMEVGDLVVSRVRDPVRVLAPTRVRIRAGRDPDLRLELLPALACLPHMAHDDDRPPRLGEGARVIGGASRFARSWDDAVHVSVALEISPRGELDEVRILWGGPDLADRVRAALEGVRIDPALLNGEPVPGTLTVTFRFPPPEG